MPKDMNIKKEHKNKQTKSTLFDEKSGGFGKYQESTGGGTPFEKGNTNTRTTRENGKLRQQNNDTNQPRTNDGKFTYNSVNGKGLKQPSRGVTVNPLLTGGENGVRYKDMEHAHDDGKQYHGTDKARDTQKWKNWAESHQWWEKGTEIVGFDGKIHLTAQSLMDLAREYDPETKKFKGEEDIAKGETKKGRHTLGEKGAIQKAEKKGYLGKYFVPAEKKQESGNKYKEFNKDLFKKKQEQPVTPAPAPEPVQPTPVQPTPPTPEPIPAPPEITNNLGLKFLENAKTKDFYPNANDVKGSKFDQARIDNLFAGAGIAYLTYKKQGNMDEAKGFMNAMMGIGKASKAGDTEAFDNRMSELRKEIAGFFLKYPGITGYSLA